MIPPDTTMGPKKKNPHNDFYFFMQDQKKNLRREGYEWNSMDELVSICSPRWKHLPDQDKSRYKEMAKNAKERERDNLAHKFDAQGRSLLDIETEKERKEREYASMMSDIEETIKTGCLSGTITKQKFYTIHFNILEETSEGKFLPCEMSLVEFSLDTGISRTLHTFMRPEKHMIPVGYAYLIQCKAEKTHGLIPDKGPLSLRGVDSWDWILTQLEEFVKTEQRNGEFPPLYTSEDLVNQTGAILEDLMSRSNDTIRRRNHRQFKIHQVHQLLYKLSDIGTKNKVFISDLRAKRETDKEYYMYSQDVACPFHDWADKSPHCSQMYTKRWAYVILNNICPEFGINLLPDRHFPPNPKLPIKSPAIDKIYLVKWTTDESPPEMPLAEKNLFDVTKTRALPAGHVNPVSEDEEIYVRVGASSVWADDYQSDKQSEYVKLSDVQSKSSLDSWNDEVDAVPIQQQKTAQPTSWPNQASRWVPEPKNEYTTSFTNDTNDFPPLSMAASQPRARGSSRRGRANYLTSAMSNMKL